MKHARPDYAGIQDPTGKIPDDEPVFLLRAQDRLAPTLVHIWAMNAKMIGADPEIVAAGLKQSEEMAAWQAQHGKKTPDMPHADAAPARALADGTINVAPSAPGNFTDKLSELGITWRSSESIHSDGRITLFGARHVPVAFLPAWASLETEEESQ